VALGSSFAAGGAQPVLDPYCGRSSNNYAHILARTLDLQLTDVTCGGATIDNLLDVPQQIYSGAFLAPQIDAVGPHTDLVTITVGGNDVNYIGSISSESCLADPTAFDAIEDSFYRTMIKAGTCGGVTDPLANQNLIDGLEDEWVEVIDSVRQRAPHARIVVVDYMTLIPASGQACDASPLTQMESKYFLDMARQLHLTTKAATQRTGTDLVELSKASRLHHACSEEPWVTGWDVSRILEGGPGPWHPNTRGVEATAELLLAHLDANPRD
jgi:hypothetical protein